MKFEYLNKNMNFKNFYSTVNMIQGFNKSFFFSSFQKFYKKILGKLFKVSSVSVNFRISLKESNLSIKAISETQKIEISSTIIKLLNDKETDKYSTNTKTIQTIIKYVCERINLTEDDLKIDILFLKRKVDPRDLYSGEIAFPGGKYEKEDGNTFNTALRETFEETSLKLCENSPIISRYIGENNNFETTLNMKYIVINHLFVIFDFFNEVNSHIKLSENEMSDFIWVPMEFFYQLEKNRKENFSEYFKTISSNLNLLGKNEVSIEKIKLNMNEDYMLYGMTLRIVLDVLNKSTEKKYITYDEKYELKGILKNICLKVYLRTLSLLKNTNQMYNMTQFILCIILAYFMYKSYFNSKKPKF